MNNVTDLKAEHKANAYFTLEACVIMPFVFGVVVFIMYVGFYSYDQCLLRQDVYRLHIRGSQVKNASNEDVVNKIMEEDFSWYHDKYVMYACGDKCISVDHDSINISGEGRLNVTFPLGNTLVGENAWAIKTESDTIRIHPVDTIRSCRKIVNLLEKETK